MGVPWVCTTCSRVLAVRRVCRRREGDWKTASQPAVSWALRFQPGSLHVLLLLRSQNNPMQWVLSPFYQEKNWELMSVVQGHTVSKQWNGFKSRSFGFWHSDTCACVRLDCGQWGGGPCQHVALIAGPCGLLCGASGLLGIGAPGACADCLDTSVVIKAAKESRLLVFIWRKVRYLRESGYKTGVAIPAWQM